MAETYRLIKRRDAENEPNAPRLIKRRGGNRSVADEPAQTPEETRSLLSQAGGVGLSGLHTVGSLLSTVSRGTHGTINALTGGEGGFGNLNPIDSTGGIEGSRHLERMGILAKNDPTKWEWRDPLAGVADIAMDPLTYAAGVGLVKRAASGISNLTGLTRAAKAVAGTKVGKSVISNARAIGDWRVGGKTHEDLADLMEPFIRGGEDSERATRAMTARLGRERVAAGHVGPDSESSFRMAAEGVDPTRFPNHGPFDPAHPHVTELVSAKDAARERAQMSGVARGLGDVDDVVGHFPRYLSDTAEQAVGGRGASELAGTGTERASRKLSTKGFHRGTTGVDELLSDPNLHAAIAAAGTGRNARRAAALGHIEANYSDLIERGMTMPSGKVADRYKRLATKIVDQPNLTKSKLFGNDPYSDVEKYITGIDKRVLASEPVYTSIGRNLAKGGVADGVPVGRFLTNMGYETDIAAGMIAKKIGLDPLDPAVIKSVKSMKFDPKLADELADLTPNFTSPRAVAGVKKFAKSAMRVAKAYTLSLPKSRMRDAVGGVVRNLLDGGGHYGDARKVLAGQEISLAADAAIPEIADWLSKSGKAATPENVTEAWRQLGGNHFGGSGVMNDIPANQVGRSLNEVTGHVFGQTPKTPMQQFITDPFMTMMGRGPDPDVRWTGSSHGWANPIMGIRGVGDTQKTTMPFVNAAEQVASYSDDVNRLAPFIQKVRRGDTADAAREAVNSAQVNYSPTRFTATERGLRDNLVPFYAYAKGSTVDTARQLANPASGTAQMIRATDRAYGNDQRVPDYIQSGSSIPLGQLPDGTLRYLGGGGFMHEDATKRIGQVLGGDTVGLGYGGLSMLNPILKTIGEKTTGQVFHQRGAPMSQADPTIGRTLANIGDITGLRPAPADGSHNPPVTFPGSSGVEALMGMMPLSVIGATARQATDTRRGIGDVMLHGQDEGRTAWDNAGSLLAGAAPLLTGAQINDISPRAQTYSLIKRAEDAAKASGAKTRADVYYNKAELERLKSDNPKLYEQQLKLQALLKGLKKKKAAK